MRPSEARQLAEGCLIDSHPRRWRHVEGVAARAQRLTNDVDENPLVSAAWLHDIGYAPTVAYTGLHALDGAAWLASRNVDPMVVSLVAFHTGAEFEADERALLGELMAYARPPQQLLDTLILCDLTVSPVGTDTGVADRIAEIVARYGTSDPVHRAVLKSSEYLFACCARAASRTSAEEWGVAVL
ncbi:HD domain-containing protein [Arthrobacter sp. NEB 688]|uniref:HD domain-containing protein n=1 Tax=Arthrobacter sp. NEB 688 TaxID=904039 RepID=UPI0015643BA3|nr:HD domain-containing protein [Arthrobacter sp. NEB 688]QKE82760.1 HD domain-containing protein [Arthrobacter sp. NEB 688]